MLSICTGLLSRFQKILEETLHVMGAAQQRLAPQERFLGGDRPPFHTRSVDPKLHSDPPNFWRVVLCNMTL